MAQIIKLHKAAKGRMRLRTFEPTGRPAKIILFTGIRYERTQPGPPAGKASDRRKKG